MLLNLLIWVSAGFVIALAYKALLKTLASKTPHGLSKNIGKSDRLVRLFIGILLLIAYIFLNASPILAASAGFCFFEAIFSWCGFYAAIGKNTCPM